jgi:hypothetical protein
MERDLERVPVREAARVLAQDRGLGLALALALALVQEGEQDQVQAMAREGAQVLAAEAQPPRA